MSAVATKSGPPGFQPQRPAAIPKHEASARYGQTTEAKSNIENNTMNIEVKAAIIGKIPEGAIPPSAHPHGKMFTVTTDTEGLFRYLAPLQIAGKTHVGSSGGFLTRAEAEACAKRDERKWRAAP